MAWNEFYVFKADGTFSKSRIQNETQTTISGRYIVKNHNDEKYLELMYSNDSSIIESCYGNSKEELYFIAHNNTLSNASSYCDGPGFLYEKK